MFKINEIISKRSEEKDIEKEIEDIDLEKYCYHNSLSGLLSPRTMKKLAWIKQ